jgi:DNA-binding NtrC family response regulator
VNAPTIIGQSAGMLKVFEMIGKVSPTEATVLIFGESGTGKELVAREIHRQSKRAEGPFLSINCGALPRDLLESLLFGHKRGSFTSAYTEEAGHFVACKGGTFFLDEVGEMAPATQVKLLRALQEREIIPIGSSQTVPIDVRMIAATNANLERDVSEGRFRKDLFYRLNVIPIRLPALRERADDIPALAAYFLAKHPDPKWLQSSALTALMKYDWPGNVRELENVIERMVILCESQEIGVGDLPAEVRGDRPSSGTFSDKAPAASLDSLEREYILHVMRHCSWVRKKALGILEINAATLSRKLARYHREQLERRGDGFQVVSTVVQ